MAHLIMTMPQDQQAPLQDGLPKLAFPEMALGIRGSRTSLLPKYHATQGYYGDVMRQKCLMVVLAADPLT